MKKPMLQINDLTVAVEDRELLHHVNLEIKRGETHVLMGPNGAGKSTLGNVLMGNPKYQVKGGTIHFLGKISQRNLLIREHRMEFSFPFRNH